MRGEATLLGEQDCKCDFNHPNNLFYFFITKTKEFKLFNVETGSSVFKDEEYISSLNEFYYF